MKTIKVKNLDCVPEDFTGIAECCKLGKFWYANRQLHREDGPAVEWLDGTKEWHLNGDLHREEGPCTTCKDCLKGNFVFCTKPGPAVEYADGTKMWCLNGERHREDGPAVEFSNGIKEWYLDGKKIDKKTVELYYMLKYKKEWEHGDEKI